MKMFSPATRSFILLSGGKNLQFLHFERFQQANFLFETVINITNNNMSIKLKMNSIKPIHVCGKPCVSLTVIHIRTENLYT